MNEATKKTGWGCGMMIAAAFGILVMLMLMGGCGVYGTVVSLRNSNTDVDGKYAQLDNMLERKAKLVPNLVATVKGYAKHEQAVFGHVAEARSKLLNAQTPVEKGAANDGLNMALGRLLMLTENYPQLKADKHFTGLMDELAGSENRIATARMDYNNTVARFNKRLNSPINSVIASAVNLRPREFFSASAEARANNVKVEF